MNLSYALVKEIKENVTVLTLVNVDFRIEFLFFEKKFEVTCFALPEVAHRITQEIQEYTTNYVKNILDVYRSILIDCESNISVSINKLYEYLSSLEEVTPITNLH